jgi:endonuclease-3
MSGEKKNIIYTIYGILSEKYGPQKCFLKHSNAFQLLVMTILSAQCSDNKVNAAAPAIFAKYPDATAMSFARFAELSRLIKPLGLFRAKTKYIISTSKILCERFEGKIPNSMTKLIGLPGVGRKTANVILGHVFNKPGFPVDTHVRRIMRRLGYASEKDSPEKIEHFVNSNMNKKYWSDFSLLLISHGRAVCKAGHPNCDICEIRRFCKFRDSVL